MGAIEDRLTLTLQDVKEWLKISLQYTDVTVVIEPAPADNQIYFVLVDDQKAEIDAGVAPTPQSVSLAVSNAIDALGIAGMTATDNADGSYKLENETPYSLYLSPGQSPRPIDPLDFLLETLILVAKQLADQFCNNPFAELDDNFEVVTEIPIPDAVRVGVLQIIDWLRTDQLTSGDAAGPVKKKEVGDIKITYATKAEILGNATTTGLPGIVRNILSIYRLIPGFDKPRKRRPRTRTELSDMATGDDNLLNKLNVEDLRG